MILIVNEQHCPIHIRGNDIIRDDVSEDGNHCVEVV